MSATDCKEGSATNMTIYELAKELNMTPAMVSRAFNPDAKINEEKRKLVLETAEKYNFSPNKFASRLSMRKIKIGIFINSKFSISCDKMLLGIKYAHELLKDYKIEYDITVFQSGEKAIEDYEEVIRKYTEFDGMIVTGLSSEKYSAMLNSAYKTNKNIVQVQGINVNTEYLFASKHNEETASCLAAEFLYNSLKYSENKNIILFTGDTESTVHRVSQQFFVNACDSFGLNILECIDMKDSEETLREIVPSVFEKYDIGGIYITSGVSTALCEYMEEKGIDIPFVAFDTHDKVKEYLEKGIISATISQNVVAQMENAFELLVKHIIDSGKCEKNIYTDVQLVLKSNMKQFE